MSEKASKDVKEASLSATGNGDKPAQRVTVEDVGPARKRLTIEVPAERIAEKISESFDRLRTDAAVPGFRRGRAPRRLLEKRFGSSLRDDIRGQLLSESYTQAIEDEELDIIGDPDVKDVDAIVLPDEGPLKFDVEVEISPTFDLPPLEGVAVKKAAVAVSDAELDEQINRAQTQMGRAETVEGAAKAGDYAQGPCQILPVGEGKAEGEADPDGAGDETGPIAKQDNLTVLIPEKGKEDQGHVAGIHVADLSKHLVGKKAGDKVSIELTGPPSHEHDRIRNQPIRIELEISVIRRVELCPLEDLVKMQGLESEDAFRDQIRKGLTDQAERKQQGAMREQVSDYLLEKTEMVLPEALTSQQTYRVLKRAAMEMAYKGLDQAQIEQNIAQMRESSEDRARRQLKLFFILDQVSKKLDVDVTEAEVNGRIAMMAMQEGRRPEKVAQQLRKSGEIEHLYLLILEQKTLDKLLESAKVTETGAKDAPGASAGTKKKPAAKSKPAAKATDKPKTESKPKPKASKTGDVAAKKPAPKKPKSRAKPPKKAG